MDIVEQQQPQDDSLASEPPKKRARKGARDAVKRRSAKKSLSKLTDMPLDVIYEILSRMHPADLLSVARSTKTFRGLLMKRSAKTIWRTSYAAAGIPDCPTRICEPACASLLFTSNCTFCAKPGIQTIEWVALIRCCKKCRQNTDLFIDLNSNAAYELGVEPWHHRCFLPLKHDNALLVRLPDVCRFLIEVQDCAGNVQLLTNVLGRRLQGYMDFLDQVLPIKQWHLARLQDRQRELADLKEQRRNAVWAKLAELGLEEERDLMSHWDLERLEAKEGMKETTPLTDRVWEKVKDSIIAYVQSIRKERLRAGRYAPYTSVINALTPLLNEYARAQPLTELFPNLLEFCMDPQVRPMVEELAQAGVDGLDVARVTELIPQVCNAFKADISSRVAKLLPPWLRRPDAEELAALDSALVWFHCTGKSTFPQCSLTTIAYPRVVQHYHIYSFASSVKEPQTTDDDLTNAVCENWDRKKAQFSPALLDKHISFDLRASWVAAEIVSACGLDPATASSADMDALDARIACVPCRRAMSWRKAVSHVFKSYHAGTREWVLLDSADTKALRALETKLKPKALSNTYYCTRCRQFDGGHPGAWKHRDTKDLKRHIAARHGEQVTRAKEGRDFYHIEGEPTSDKERPYEVEHKDFGFTVSTPTLVAQGW